MAVLHREDFDESRLRAAYDDIALGEPGDV
jgi:hypothetical protein